MPAKKTYTLTEAAKKLKISRQAVHKAIAAGSLKARRVKVTREEWQISAKALESYSVSALHQSIGKKIIDG
jgi:excisionase family DNA binding protein